MPKDITPQVEAALAKTVKGPITFIEAHFDDGISRLCTGLGPWEFDGHIWQGAGDLLGLSSIPDNVGLASHKLDASLNGVRVENISQALGQVTQGSAVKVWQGFVDQDENLIPNPVLVFSGEMDVPEIKELADGVDLKLSVEGAVNKMQETVERRRTHEDQQINYPGDMGLKYVAGLQDKEVPWG